MSSTIVKPTANQITLTTANTVYNSALVYLASTTATLITITNANSVVTGTFVVPASQFLFVQKAATDTLTANVAISASPAVARS